VIVDCHMHVKGGDLYRREFSADFIVRCLDEAGIDRAVVFSICLGSRESNNLTYREAQKFSDRLIGFAHVNPEEGDLAVEELERAIRELNFKGVKIHFGEFAFSKEIFLPVMDEIVKLKIPCLIDCKEQYNVIGELADTYPETKIIVAHLGSHNNEKLVDRFIGLAKRKENLFLDSSWSDVPWKIGDAITIAGAEKVLFGSDGPLIHPLIELTKVKVLKLKREEEELILGRNILNLLPR